MNSLSIVVFCVAVAVASAAPGHLAHGLVAHAVPYATGAVVQGPGSRSTVAGPDGSVINAADDGGAVVSDALGGTAVVGPSAAATVHSAVGVHGFAPVLAAGPVAYAAHAAPLAYAAHAYHSAPVAYAAHAYHTAPLAYAGHAIAAPAIENTVIAGPSGTVATSKHVDVVSAPALYHGAIHGGPAVYAANVW